ncbi:hypothetical protein EA797_05620 [Stutzerimonas zhaodongensis]|uniref:MetS family NSS transporter small subunit n=1 Tax=Stutzerimonas zhaodongensis TaxID=1176257 RepID=A0A3M2HYN9_9GAMM|nr:hypothetical protein [Stutzerimonas zhaodongensis]MCQ4314695.1 hypothetical protein [Stutzerimonas zhaodongensis]RMH92760.1 hypothetical protein EA797_05620 [Stutzerimonas zhaodongensis]
MTPALIIFLMVIGWSAAALAMLWGMLRIARHHHKPSSPTRLERPSVPAQAHHQASMSIPA